jgi:HD-GYP domain-containing protein (c-di-GMP phosphodiesterase class II)
VPGPELGGAGARVLVAAIQQLATARSHDEIQRIVRGSARRLVASDGATFVLRDGQRCHYVDEDAISALWKGQRFASESCISGWAMRNRRPVAIEDIYADERIAHAAYRPTFVRSLVLVPIRRDDPIGAIGTYWADRHVAGAEEIELLQALADSTAVAIQNLRVLEDLEAAHLETLHRLALAGEYRDDETRQHTERVAHSTRCIALALGLDEDEAAQIGQAALLHDIGKLSISDAILRKQGSLTADEFELVKGHAASGAAILFGSTSAVLRVAREIALTHHERWDGSGYPTGTAGEAIPLSGRIVAVADVFDALSHARPYKQAWPPEDARAEIERLAGAQFDPVVVEAFLGLDARDLVHDPAVALA